MSRIKEVEIAGPPPKAKRVKPFVENGEKAEYVYKRTSLEIHANANPELERDLVSPSLEEIGHDTDSDREI